MTGDVASELAETLPGRMLIETYRKRWVRKPNQTAADFANLISARSYSADISMMLSGYLYGDAFREVLELDTTQQHFVEMRDAIGNALRDPSRREHRSPERHHGKIAAWRELRPTNRKSPEALPAGAFWTSPVFAEGAETWSLHGEHDIDRSPEQYSIHFDSDDVHCAHIESASDWHSLLDAHGIDHRGTRFPDWVSIAREWDAVHVSLAGLLCAQPQLSVVPYVGDDPSGYTHSQSGPYVGVGSWTVASTAWLRRPRSMRIEHRVRI